MTAHPVDANHGHWWLASARRLHAVPGAAVTWERIEDALDLGLGVRCPTACGLRLPLRYAGIGARLGGRRCVACCDALGVPHGWGTPANERSMRERGLL